MLRFLTGPVHLDEDGEELRTKLALHLAEAVQRPVQVVASRSYASVAEMVGRGDAELAWLPPAIFVRAEQASPVRLLCAVERSRGAGYRGVLFVPQDSDVQTPDALTGKRVAWVDRDSCAGHLFPRLALREAGLEPNDMFGEQRFEGSHGAVVRAVMRGDADCGATHAQTLDDGETLMLAGWQPYAGHDGMRALLVTAPIPPDVICASSALDPDALDDVRQALLALHESDDAQLLDEFFGGHKLIAAHTADYDAVRAAML
ncbi:MAG: phosphate/phosphite/phosphonate ABC transporter substrate-binding protein [Sandaracinaceae bacterium]|nr:hypothetical protein [Myxococcales bacterium]